MERKLHVGCGFQHLKGYLNCDLYPNPGVDVTFDLQKGWPFEADSCSQILASHVLEHLLNPMAFFKEAWRVLKPNGIMILYLPYGASNAGIGDITHVKFWIPLSFGALLPGHKKEVGNPQHDYDCAFYASFIGARINPKFRWMCKWPVRYWGLDFLWHLWGGHEEMIVNLIAIKDKTLPAPDTLPVSQVMYRHNWERRKLKENELPSLVTFSVEHQKFTMVTM